MRRIGKATAATQRERRRRCDTVLVPALREGFEEVFLGESRWYAVRMSRGARERVKYIAAYQGAPISAVTHMAEIRDIRPYEDSGKYMVSFKGPAWQINPVPLRKGKKAPQGPVYVKKEDLLRADYLDEAFDLT